MDIYIGGVRDRNAALHGDVVVVEIKPTDQWKVLYDQLDQYLDKHIDEKIIVYSPLESNITASVADAASFYNPISNNTNNEKSTKKKNRDTYDQVHLVESVTPLQQCDSDVIVEDEDEEDVEAQEKESDKRKKKKKRKKAKSKNTDESQKNPAEVSTTSPGGIQDEEGIDVVVLLQPEPVKVADELVLLSCPTVEECRQVPQQEDFDDNKKKDVVVVPPDQLSEHDFTDDESGCSEILDYSQAREDQSFMQAQWEAAKKENQQRQKEGPPYDLSKTQADKASFSSAVVVKNDPSSAGNDLKQEIALGFPDGFVKETKDVQDIAPELVIGEKVLSANDVNIVKKEEKSVSVCEKNDAAENTEATQGASAKLTKKKPRKNKKPSGQDQLQLEVEEKIKSLGLEEFNAPSKSSCANPKRENITQNRNLGAQNNQKMAHRQPNFQQNTSHRKQEYFSPQMPREPQQMAGNRKMGGNRHKMDDKKERKQLSVAQIQRLPNWNNFVQKTAHVVSITERKHTRTAAGVLKMFGDKNPNYALFSPNDNRVPRMKIPMMQCPPDFMARNQDYLARIFLAKIAQWREPKFALGELVRDVGAVGDIEAETEAFLNEHNIDHTEFTQQVTRDLPILPWSIPPEELSSRVDLRNECIFTIDPSTARDLDDALSCVPLKNGNFRVGVHIADVTYFLKEETPLDQLASQRATTFYLTQKVIPMLPEVLCQHLCSLNPGEDRLAFSVIWELTPKGEIIGEWFGRTVIHSCAKLAYDHAQSMIDEPDRQWLKDEIPPIYCGYTTKDVSKIVNNLQSIAVKLRKRRFTNGALCLDQVKIHFNLDWETKMPNGFYSEDRKDSHKLVEELMLLANIAVAHKINQAFPDLALLRRHPPPNSNPLKNVVETLAATGINLDSTSSGSLYTSIYQHIGNDKYSQARLQVIISLCSKPMQNAKYFCAGMLGSEAMYHHYALNVPLYTHFTSPIRRYADVMVHRLLAAAVDPGRYKKPVSSGKTLQRCADHCNDKKQTSKIVQELSTELYLGLFIRRVAEMVEEAMVTAILDHSFDVLLLNLGLVKRVYTDKLPIESLKHEKSCGKLTLYWQPDDSGKTSVQELSLFTLVTVNLRPVDGNALKFNTVLVRPS